MTLTREEILAMEPGRLLDTLIAKEVMGMDLVDNGLPYLPRYYLPEYDRTIHRDVPLYSSDISAAWEVAEKLKDTFHFSLVNDVRCEGYFVSFETLEGKVYECDADTMPEAICKCALLAVLNL